MNFVDVILIVVIGAACALAVRKIVTGKSRGKCCGDCCSCSSGSCEENK